LCGALAVGIPGLFALPILLAGSEEQKKRYLPEIIAGAWQPYTSALVEYNYDFDPQDLKTTARLQDQEYLLNGEKAFVPFAQEAAAILVYAKLNDQTQAFIVPRDTPGLTVFDEREKLMSLNAFPMYRIKLENVKVIVTNKLGDSDADRTGILLASMRVAQSALALGVARAAFEYARDYAKEREVFGVKIAQKQAIAFMLAEMLTELEATRLLTWQAAWKLDAGKDDAFIEAYLACTGAIDMVMMVTDRAVQILGGHGYIREHPVEMWMRNGRGFAMLTGFAMV
jgi:alkylation response protein AidB-like acyl-CoA dehydrogenase